MKRGILVFALALVAARLPVQAALSEEFQFARAFVWAASLYKSADERIFSSTAPAPAKPEDPVQTDRAANYRLSLAELDKANSQIAPFIQSRRPEMVEGANAFLAVSQMARTVYEANIRLIEQLRPEQSQEEQDKVFGQAAEDFLKGRDARISALAAASNSINKVVNNDQAQGRLKLADIERQELIKLINIKFPKTRLYLTPGAETPITLDGAMASVLPFLQKSKGRSAQKH